MYIDKFIAGILVTVMVELIIVLTALIVTIIKHIKNGGNKNV